MAKPLNERIASARSSDRVTITDLRALITEIGAEQERLAALQARSEADSVDIALSEELRDEAAATGARHARLALAYGAAIRDLDGKLQAKLEADSQRLLDAERKAALAERDEIANQWREIYPRVVDELVALFAATKANDERLRVARIYEANAEATARGLTAQFAPIGSVGYFAPLVEMKIMDFSGRHRAWPPEGGGIAQWARPIAIAGAQSAA